MANTLADLRIAVRDRGSFNAADTKVTDAFVNRGINRALQQVSREADWPWLRTSAVLTSVVGQAEYASPAGWIRTESINDSTTGHALVRHPVRILDRLTYPGRPSYYSLENSTITLGPTPDGVYSYKHRYVQAEPALVADTDVPLIPEGYNNGVVLLAVQWLCSSIREMDRAAEAYKDFQNWRVRVIDNVNVGREPLRIEPREGAWL